MIPPALPAPRASSETEASLPTAVGRVVAAAEVIELEPGLYAVDIVATEVARAGRGMVLPCIHIGPLPGDGVAGGRAFVATMSRDSLIVPDAHAAYIRVEQGNASMLLTTYRLADVQAAPEVRLRRIGPAAEAAPAPAPGPLSLPLVAMAHIERAGDVSAAGGHWVGRPGGGAVVEGFAITPREQVRPAEIEYQALLGGERSTPWMRGGEFCGSRGMSLSTLGLRVRLIGRAARKFGCIYGASFVGGGVVGPVSDGAACTAGDAPMEAFWISLAARTK